MNLPHIIYSWIYRLNKVSSIYSVAIALSFFGISSFFYGFVNGFYIAIASFSISCYLELIHSKAKASIAERNQAGEWNPIYPHKLNNLMSMKIIRQFTYEGFRFNVISFDNSNVPVEVTCPLCPRPECDNKFLASTPKIKFPGRAVMIFKCSCGFRKESKKTEVELYKEARKLCGGS